MEAIEHVLASLPRAAEHRAEIVEPGDSFWYHRSQRDFPPRLIHRPEDHTGADRLSIACGQTGLRYLHIGSSPSFEPMDVFGTLRNLVWLELENIRAAADLSFVASRPQLVGLSVAGDSNSLRTLALKTLRPFSNGARAGKCRQKTMVRLAGRGKQWLCMRCDAVRIAKHEAAFAAIVAAQRA